VKPFTVANAQIQGERDNQEDSFGFSKFSEEGFISHGGYLAVIADGMGGLEYGSDSSYQAVQAFLDAYARKEKSESISAALQRAAESANKVVLQLARKLNGINKMGTTLAAAVIHGDRLHWISFGDSRIYLFQRDGFLHQLTVDQTLRQSLEARVQTGEISSEDADKHPKAHALTNYIGIESLADGSSSPQDGIQLHEDEWLILCSDGLSGTLTSDEIIAEIRGSAERAVSTLVQKVAEKKQTNQDNCTILVFRFNHHIKLSNFYSLLKPVSISILALLFLLMVIGAIMIWGKLSIETSTTPQTKPLRENAAQSTSNSSSQDEDLQQLNDTDIQKDTSVDPYNITQQPNLRGTFLN